MATIPYINYKDMKEFYTIPETCKLFEMSKIDTNPVPLRKSFVAPCLPGPVELLHGIAGGNMPVEYMQIKS